MEMKIEANGALSHYLQMTSKKMETIDVRNAKQYLVDQTVPFFFLCPPSEAGPKGRTNERASRGAVARDVIGSVGVMRGSIVV